VSLGLFRSYRAVTTFMAWPCRLPARPDAGRRRPARGA
jgi:hypothetical protein